MDNLKQLLSLIFEQPQGGGSSPFSKSAFPSLLGGQLLSTMPGRFEKTAGMGLDALGLLASLSK